jgi:hypothetical protein
MKINATLFLAFSCLLVLGCSRDNYPENMSRAERKAYYDEFNASRTPEEWQALREERAESKTGRTDAEETVEEADRNPGSVPVSIRNNSLLPRKVRIKDNVLAFKPFETRYIGFPEGTACYLLYGKEEKYLFTINAEDKNDQFKIFH